MKYLPKPVVVMSSLAKAGSDMARRAREAGACDVFDKARLDLQESSQLVRNLIAPAIRRAAQSKPGAR